MTPDDPREGAGCTVGMFVGLLLLLGLVGSFLRFGRDEVDGAEIVGLVFGDGPPPGFERVEAARRASGEELVRLERTDGTDGPAELLVVRYPSKDAVDRLFSAESEEGEHGGDMDSGSRMLEWEADPDFAWHTTLEAGAARFGAWQADFVLERAFEEGGGWQDAAWVDLSRPTGHVVLFALWAPGISGSKAGLQQVLRHVALR